jgi:hypothetical protein
LTFEQERDQQREWNRRFNRRASYVGLVILIACLLWNAWLSISRDPAPPVGCQFHSDEICSSD